MLEQPNDNGLSFKYLALDDQDLVANSLKHFLVCQDQIPKVDIEQLKQVLQILTTWRMPAKPILALLSYYLSAYGLLLHQEKKIHSFGNEILQMAYNFGALDQSPVNPDDPRYSMKAYRIERLRKLLLTAYNSDLELTLLCVAAHIVRMRSIGMLDFQNARLLAKNNEVIFLPLLEMLGMWQIRREMGNLSLELLNQKLDDRIRQQQKLAKDEQKKHYERIREILAYEMDNNDIKGDMYHHFSPPSSIYRRMLRGGGLTELVRLVKIDVVVNTEAECYQVLRLIHWHFPPQVGRTLIGGYFRDLIATPKYNGYRALVTTVGYRQSHKSKTEIPIEFRIRTQEMERTNSYGIIAARFLSVVPIAIRNAWWENQEVLGFVRSHLVDSRTEQIYVFSPIGEVYQLPQGSTPIDYAYRVHSEVGDHCKHIWVNGRPTSYAQKLRNGDLIEIEIDPSYLGPYEKWAGVVKTSNAKIQIKRALKWQQATPPDGKKIIDKILKKELEYYDLIEIPQAVVEKYLEDTARYFGYSDLTALYFDIADSTQLSNFKKPSPNRIVARLIATYLANHIVTANGEEIGFAKNRIKFSQCFHKGKPCRVSPGSKIVGYVKQEGTRHARLVIYRRDCPNSPDEKNGIPLAWRGDRRPGEPVKVVIQAVARDRLLDNILQVVYGLYKDGLRILGLQAEVSRDQSAVIHMTIDSPDYQPIELLSTELNRLREASLIDSVHINALSPIEKLLLAEPDILPNPYTPGPARNQRIFKGRDMEIRQITNGLSGDQNVIVLYGLSRVGKTSLLHYICDHIAQDYNFVPVLIDMQGLIEYTKVQLWVEIAARISETMASIYKDETRFFMLSRGRKKRDFFDDFRKWLSEISVVLRGRKLLIMIDELNVVDELWDRKEALSFIYQMKSLVESQFDVAFIFCVQENLYKQAISSETRTVCWPLLKTGIPLRLDFLDRLAAERLIREPMGQMLKYDDGVVEKMLQLTAGHPYYLQNMLHQMINVTRLRNYNKSVTLKITSDDLEVIIPQLLSNGQQLFYDFLQEYRGIKRAAILSALAYVSNPDERGALIDEIQFALEQREIKIRRPLLIRTLEDLREKNIIERFEDTNQTKYYIRVPLFGRWLRENRPLRLIPPRRKEG